MKPRTPTQLPQQMVGKLQPAGKAGAEGVKKESQQLVNYLLSQGKSEQEAKEEASNFEKMQALQETEGKDGSRCCAVGS